MNTTKRLRYVCTVCGETNVTARGHAVHADRDHPNHTAPSERRWVKVP